MPTPSPTETWTRTSRGLVHAYVSLPVPDELPDGTVVVLPGLGLPQYVRPFLDELSAHERTWALLDLPGFGATDRSHGPHGSVPHIDAVAAAAAAWVRSHHRQGAVTLLGHSTGAQAAMGAALALQGEVDGLVLVMAGPTFVPPQRRLGTLVRASLTAYRHDSPRELVVVPTLMRHAAGVWAFMRSGMRDAPERRVAGLTAPLALTSGLADTFAPQAWLDRLAGAAGGPAVVHPAPGSHNNPFTHPADVADAVRVAEALAGR